MLDLFAIAINVNLFAFNPYNFVRPLPMRGFVVSVTGPNILGVVFTHSGYSSEDSNLHGTFFGTLNNRYFQQNTSTYISHDTGTIMTPNDTGGIEIRSRPFSVL
jgi:hypothetical protein